MNSIERGKSGSLISFSPLATWTLSICTPYAQFVTLISNVDGLTGAVKLASVVAELTSRCVAPAVTFVNIQSKPDIRYAIKVLLTVLGPNVMATVCPVYPNLMPGALRCVRHEFLPCYQQKLTYAQKDTFFESHLPLYEISVAFAS
jgi:hypothetical protein